MVRVLYNSEMMYVSLVDNTVVVQPTEAVLYDIFLISLELPSQSIDVFGISSHRWWTVSAEYCGKQRGIRKGGIPFARVF